MARAGEDVGMDVEQSNPMENDLDEAKGRRGEGGEGQLGRTTTRE